MSEEENIENAIVFVQLDKDSITTVVPSWTQELLTLESQKNVLDRTADFVAEARGYDRDDLLALTGMYSLRGGFLAPGANNPYPETVDVEFLQAITLGIQSGERPKIPREKVSDFWTELQHQVYVLGHQKRDIELSRLEALAQSHNAYYRNPYGDHFFDLMISRITDQYDQRFLRNGTFKKAGESIVIIRNELMQRAKDQLERARTVVTGSREEKISAVNGYCGIILHQDLESYNEEDLISALSNILEDIAVEKLFFLDEDWVDRHEALGYPMREVLEKLSISDFIEENSPAKILKINPVWERPVDRLSEGYSVYSIVTFMSFPFALLMVLLGGGEKEKLKLEKVRGSFVEEQLQDMLTQKFPSATIVRGGFWHRKDGNRVETDLVLYLAGRLIIFEAKGALIPDRAKLGKKDAIKHYLRRVWGKSTLQGTNLEQRISESNKPLEIFDQSGNVRLRLTPDDIVSVTRYSVSIEQLGIFMNAPSLLKKEGVLEGGVSPAPCIILSELNMVLEGLKSEEARLHYLSRRGFLTMKRDFVGDELDFFSTYMQFGFTALPDDDSILMLLGASFHLQSMRDDDGKYIIPSQSPLRNSAYFEKLLETMKGRKSPLFQHISLLLLDFSLPDQYQFEAKLNRAISEVNSSKDNSGLVFSFVKSLVSSFVVAGMAFNGEMSGPVMRAGAIKILDELILKNGLREGMMMVKIKNSPNVYDAMYYSAPKVTK